ncbi:TM2 domain-containing membrane protein YozV [Flavobacterium arsenatis]|uniref:TM2 domain-containing membrane protein YozV n=1 Tax=Flavobacterium arsenatis TaxID=1484332 RepID=A0ABU1TMW2_9FLAO|nr:hypothetical protein [Flavobacterium arsenatis]MDR6967304.1 TM2 domain-containing membrane protein YozV [Flavobacterium arsenatis]
MSILSLLLVIFPKTGYYGRFQTTVTILEGLPYIVFYGTFYIIIFLAFPATVILLVIYMLYRYVRRESLEIKAHFRLIIWNIVVLLFVFLIGYLKFSCENKSKKSSSGKYKMEKTTQKKIEIVNRKFVVEDINNDKVQVTAFVNHIQNIKNIFDVYVKYQESADSQNDKDLMIKSLESVNKLTDPNELDILINVWMYYDPTDFPTRNVVFKILENSRPESIKAVKARMNNQKEWETDNTAPYSELNELLKQIDK